MSLSRILGLKPGVSAVIGSGGKTTTLRVLGEEQTGRVVLCTTTHIRPFEGLPLYTGDSEAEVRALLERECLVCVGQRGPEGKLVVPRLSIQSLAQMADYVLVEADGSRQLPIKAHAPHEPVIPPESRLWKEGGGDGTPPGDILPLNRSRAWGSGDAPSGSTGHRGGGPDPAGVCQPDGHSRGLEAGGGAGPGVGEGRNFHSGGQPASGRVPSAWRYLVGFTRQKRYI